jgi:hypothetical protein
MIELLPKSIHLVVVLFVTTTAFLAQSSDQNFPTPVTSNEINGQIRARDVGDSRLTRFFYVFDGGQGDIFVNVVTKNFAGDIDIFTAEALRPMTKMVIYPDGNSSNETGRLIYLRKGERLLLRIEGRSPNDDPAMFRIKFGGSFIAIAGTKEEDPPSIANSQSESGIKVNSVGTIVAVKPKAPPTKPPIEIPSSVPVKATAKTESKVQEVPKTEPVGESKVEASKRVVVVSETFPVATVFNSKKNSEIEKKTPETKSNSTATKTAAVKKAEKADGPTSEPKVDPLASIRLIVQLKTGEVIERPMSEIQRFSWDKGILVVIGKDGKASRYSILDVSKVTIE